MVKKLRPKCLYYVASRLIVGLLVLGLVPQLGWASTGHGQQESKADKAKREREEKAASKEGRDVVQNQQILEEAQPELDALAMMLIDARYDDRLLQDYVNSLGQRLIPKEAPAGLLFSFRVINDSTPNAFALPDGRIYVNSGLMVFVDNEAQMAMILGHEIGHVIEQHYAEALREARSPKRLLPGLFAGLGGAAVGGAINGKEGARKGAELGAAAGLTYSFVFQMNSYSRKQEDEADRIGAKLAMDSGYDPKESLAFFQKLTNTFGEEDKFANLLWGKHSRNVERVASIRALLDSTLAENYNTARSAGRLSAGTGQLRLYASRMLRDTSIQYMDVYDRYDIAKKLLTSIEDYRSRDPITMWALGRVFTVVGRTDADRGKALDYLQHAVQLDQRGLFPFVLRDLGLAMATRGGPDMLRGAVDTLKKYVSMYVSSFAAYPSDLADIYDYLLVFGDSTWLAPKAEGALYVRANGPEPPAPTAAAGKPSVSPPGAGSKVPPTKTLTPAPIKKPGR